MRIIYFSNIFFTDCDFPLVRSLQTKGNEVYYFLPVANDKLKGGLFDLESLKGKHGIIKANEIPEIKPYQSYMNLENVYVFVRSSKILNFYTILTFIKIIWKIKPDIFHITMPLELSDFLLYMFRKKMVLTVHDPFLHSGEESAKHELKRKFAFRLIPKLVLLNKNQKEKFIDYYNISYNKVFENKLSIYDCLCYLASNKHSIEKHLPQKYILFFGHISPYKGLDTLCEAMTIVHSMDPDLHCIIAGKGDMYFDYSKYKDANYIHLENKYIETSKLASLISSCLFTVCPYKDATQSGVVYSSFALSKPVLASNVGGLGESVIDGVTGKQVVSNNPQKLAQSIISMVSNPSLLLKMSYNIKDKYERGENSWDVIADKYIECYLRK